MVTQLGNLVIYCKILLLILMTDLSEAWKNTCGNEMDGDRLFSIRVGNQEVSSSNCEISRGNNFKLSFEFSLAKSARNVTLNCDGKWAFISVNVLTTSRDCHGLWKRDNDACNYISPHSKYIFTDFYKCPSWVPSVHLKISCTAQNDHGEKTHCVSFGCRVHG